MGYSVINFSTVADLITKVEAAMITAGWTDTGLNGALGSASGNILVSAGDTDGRVCYVELYVDTAGYLGIHVSPTLNSGATDIDENMDLFRACNFQAGDWECFIYDNMVWCGRGTDPDDYKFAFGLYKVFKNVSAMIHPYTCFMHGTHGIDGGGALRPRPLSRSDNGGGVFYTFAWGDGIWKRIGILLVSHVTSTGGVGGFQPDIGFTDDATLMCHLLYICGSTSSTPDTGGLLGFLDHCIIAWKDVVLAAGDRVTLDGGTTYYRHGWHSQDYDFIAEEHMMFEV